ncbi:unnamed protein product [Gordionus sp. m RMFG-2023]
MKIMLIEKNCFPKIFSNDSIANVLNEDLTYSNVDPNIYQENECDLQYWIHKKKRHTNPKKIKLKFQQDLNSQNFVDPKIVDTKDYKKSSLHLLKDLQVDLVDFVYSDSKFKNSIDATR